MRDQNKMRAWKVFMLKNSEYGNVVFGILEEEKKMKQCINKIKNHICL